MRVKKKRLEGDKTLLEAAATASEVKTALHEIQELLAKQLGLKPDGLHTFGYLAKEQADVEDFDAIVESQVIESFSAMAIDQAKLEPAFVPPINVQKKLREGSSFNFTMEIMDKPAYELTSYDPVEVTVEQPEVTEKEVDERIKKNIEGYSDYAPEEAHPLGQGDSCLIELVVYQDGKELEALTTGPEGRVYTLNEWLMPPAFDEQLIGMAPGDEKTFDFPAPDLDENGNEIEVSCNCTVKILENRVEAKPEVTDEWVKKYMPMFDSLDEMREQTKREIMVGKDRDYQNRLRLAVSEALGKRFEGSIADEVYEATQANVLRDMRTQMTQQGVDFDEYVKEQGNMFNMQVMIRTRENLVQGYALDAVFRHENMKLVDDDFTNWCKAVAPNQNPIETRKNMERAGRGFMLREGAMRLKANIWAAEHAIVNKAE